MASYTDTLGIYASIVKVELDKIEFNYGVGCSKQARIKIR
jgi:hypothetical protein